MAEETSLAYLKKKISYGDPGSIGWVGWFRLLALRAAFALPVRWKAPALIAEIPAHSWVEAAERWDTIRNAWHELLNTLPSGMARKALFKHPSVGRMNLIQGIRFMQVHVRHHGHQIERTLVQVTGPAHEASEA